MRVPHILVVEDDALFRAFCAEALEGLGYRIDFAADVEGAMAELRRGDVDVVVADHLLPGTTGLAFLSTLREHLPGPRRILMTGRADVPLAVDAIRDAAIFRLLTKPFDPLSFRLDVCAAVDDRERERSGREPG